MDLSAVHLHMSPLPESHFPRPSFTVRAMTFRLYTARVTEKNVIPLDSSSSSSSTGNKNQTACGACSSIYRGAPLPPHAVVMEKSGTDRWRLWNRR